MKTLPINVNLDGMAVLVIGGGDVALEKIDKILPYGPCVMVVSPRLVPELQALADAGRIGYIKDVYRKKYLHGYRIVFSATGDPAVDRVVHEHTRKDAVLLNTVDAPGLCDFIMPAVVQGESFTVSIATGGKSAGLSKHIRQQLETYVEGEEEIAAVLAKIRALFKRKYETQVERRDRLWDILNELAEIEERRALEPGES